jgi:hypothetical protein
MLKDRRLPSTLTVLNNLDSEAGQEVEFCRGPLPEASSAPASDRR